MAIEAKEPDIALPGCTYGLAEADIKYIYNGVNDCRAALLLDGGTKVCASGCLGLGTCVAACPFGCAMIDEEQDEVVKCDLCGGNPACARFCPESALRYVKIESA